MLSVKWLRENIDFAKANFAKRKFQIEFDTFLYWDKERRATSQELDELKHLQNKRSKQIARLKKEKQDTTVLIDEMQQLATTIKELEKKKKELDSRITDFLLNIPNKLHSDVPGDCNVEVKRWGDIPDFDFPVKDHQQIGEDLNILDFKAAAKITGSGFVICRGMGARLERALINFMLDMHTRQGYKEILPPFMTNTASNIGTAQLPKFKEELYKCDKDDLYLVPTAEVPLTNIHREEILDEDALPLCYTAYTPCFRREAGTYGKKLQGMIRVHQFNKVELVKLTTIDASYLELEKLLQDAELVLQELKLPYRIVKLSGEELGFAASFGYDIEVWLPSQKRWLEISTCSNFESYQSRRASIKYREKATGKVRYVHTLNGSGVAVGRCVVALLENFQDEQGNVLIPDVLVPYMDGAQRINKEES